MEAGTGRTIELNDPFGPEEVADFVSAEFLRDRTLAPEETIAALDRLGVAFTDVHGENSSNGFNPDLHGRIAIPRDVLDAGAQPIGVLDPADGAVITHAQKNLPADGVRQGDHLPGERRRKVLLELDRRAFALLKQDFKVPRRHAEPSREVLFMVAELPGAFRVHAAGRGYAMFAFGISESHSPLPTSLTPGIRTPSSQTSAQGCPCHPETAHQFSTSSPILINEATSGREESAARP